MSARIQTVENLERTKKMYNFYCMCTKSEYSQEEASNHTRHFKRRLENVRKEVESGKYRRQEQKVFGTSWLQ